MSAVMVVCEGHTEQAFVSQVLTPALASRNISVESINVGGGRYERYRDDIQKEVYANYNKKLHGPRIAARIGLDNLRARCRHFGEWLTEIERRATGAQE